MFDPKRATVVRSLLALSFLLLGAGPALAYSGPGASPEFFGYFLSLIAYLGMAFSAVFLWPIYALVRKIRGPKNKPTQEPTQPQDAAQPAEAPPVSQ